MLHAGLKIFLAASNENDLLVETWNMYLEVNRKISFSIQIRMSRFFSYRENGVISVLLQNETFSRFCLLWVFFWTYRVVKCMLNIQEWDLCILFCRKFCTHWVMTYLKTLGTFNLLTRLTEWIITKFKILVIDKLFYVEYELYKTCTLVS